VGSSSPFHSSFLDFDATDLFFLSFSHSPTSNSPLRTRSSTESLLLILPSLRLMLCKLTYAGRSSFFSLVRRDGRDRADFPSSTSVADLRFLYGELDICFRFDRCVHLGVWEHQSCDGSVGGFVSLILVRFEPDQRDADAFSPSSASLADPSFIPPQETLRSSNAFWLPFFAPSTL